MTVQPRPQEVPIIPARRDGVTVVCAHAFLAIMVGLALRCLFVFWFPASAGDSEIYLQLARNWADHHVYGLWVNGNLVPTDLRMPGYPAFLAGVAIVFGRATRAIVLSQAVLDLATCLLAAALSAALAPAFARRRVAIGAMWLAATCPFVANYSAAVLTEMLATFLSTAALLCFVTGLRQKVDEADFLVVFFPARLSPFSLALLGAFLSGIATLVRPEMPLIFAVALAVYAWHWRAQVKFRKLVLAGAALAIAFLLPLAPWAVRNWLTLHEAEILAPRYATMPTEYAPVGYYSWTGTWLERYRDVYLDLWKIGEEPIDIEDIPESAFDSAHEKTRIAGLYQQYNDSENLDISPELDDQFAEIGRERTARHPLRTYLQVPFQRALTIWFTPRTELLPIDGKFWPIREQWQDSKADFLVTSGFALLGYLYVALALGGIWTVWRSARNETNLAGIALILAYLLVRTAFLTTVEAPEPRYVVTCYPVVLALAALLVSRKGVKQ
jgi:hypothetical protein